MKVLTITKEGGVLSHNLNQYSLLAENEADLANAPADAAPGSMAHTAGFAQIWELGTDGTWTAV